jgi:hypothetical protein
LLNVPDGENVCVEFRFRDGVNVSVAGNGSVAEKSAVGSPLPDWLNPELPA